jgi:hypothetical protein
MSAEMFQIRIGNTGAMFSCSAEQTILAASVGAGEVAMLPRNDASLSPAQAAAGQTLACRALPRSDVAITWLGRGRR